MPFGVASPIRWSKTCAATSELLLWLPAEQVTALLDAGDYVGDAVQRALAMAELIRQAVE